MRRPADNTIFGYTGAGMLPAIAVFAVLGWGPGAANPAELAVFGAFRGIDPAVAHFAELRRAKATDSLDVVVIIGSPKPFPSWQNSWTWWSEDRKIGLFLQERDRPERVYSLGVKAGFPDCAARIERLTATDAVISCEVEKGPKGPHQKWVYDVRAKGLVRQFSYQPFSMHRIFPIPGGAVFVGSDRERLVAVEYKANREPEFRVLRDSEALRWTRRVRVQSGTEGLESRRVISIETEARPAPKEIPPLPRTTYTQFAVARPERVKNGYGPESKIEDSIGPWQRDGERIWFGKSFYDGEGYTGVGGFGYYDVATRKLRLFVPPEVVDWSVSAIDAAEDAVWLGLVRGGEWGGSSGGLLRFDRASETVRVVRIGDICGGLVRAGSGLLAATDFGIAIVGEDAVRRYFVDVTTDGRTRVVSATP